jgi:predicted RNA-binding Zn ribbon-like protein
MVRTAAPLLGEPLPVELMNTRWADQEGVHDAIAGSAELAAWLAAAADVRVSARDLGASTVEAFGALRDALRTLAARATRDERSIGRTTARDVAAAVAVVNGCCAAAPSWSRLSWPASGAPRRHVESAGGVAETARARIAEQAVELFGSEQYAELRACYAPGCVLYFLRDHPRRQWCSAACGNRARVARHYARHRDGT